MAPASSSPSLSSRNSSSKYKLVATVASEAMGIGKSSDVLTVLGGKASCRRKFVLNLHLLDEHGNLAGRDMSIVASVAYAHDHTLVVRDDKQFLAEPPLFTTFNGVEFPAQDRPTRMVSGRASFKLALSLLSSKCDNRLFCICFTPQPDSGGGVVEPCYSKPIRSISRKRTQSAPPPVVTIPQSMSGDEEALGHKFTSSPGSSSENGGSGGGSEYSTPRRYRSRRPAAVAAAAVASDTVPVHGISSTMVVENTLKNSFCSVEKSSSLSLSLSPTSESGSPSSVVDNKLPELLEAGGQQQSPARSNNTESEFLLRPGPTRAFRPYARFPAAAMLASEFSTFARSAASEASTQSSMQHLAPGLNQITQSVQQQQNASTNKIEPSLEEEEKSLQYIEVSLQEVHRELQRRKEELVNKKRRLLEDDTRMHSIIFQSSSWIESLRGRFSL